MASSRSSGKHTGLLGSEEPRVFTPPLRELTRETSLGFAVIDFAHDILGVELWPWQQWLLKHALELLESGEFRFRTVVVLVARQNGKSTLAQVLALFFLYIRGVSLVIGTAQNLDIAEEVWQGAVDIAGEVPELNEEIKRVVQVNGKKALELYGGYRYKVQAANRRGGRGLSGDLIILDELREHQTWEAWSAVAKTTMARPDAQVWALSNAGDLTSVVLRHLRYLGHLALGNPDGLELSPGMPAEEGEQQGDESLGIFEWSAAPGSELDDMEAAAAANPSLGYSITERAVRSAMATDPEWVYRTEVLCQWEETAVEGPFPTGAWEAGQDVNSSIAEDSELAWCLDVSADRTQAHLAVAGYREDGNVHVEIVASRAGLGWIENWFKSRVQEEGASFRWTAQRRGAPVSSLIDDLAALEGLEYVDWSGPNLGNGASLLWDLVDACLPKEDEKLEPDETPPKKLYHLPQPVLDLAAGYAATKAGGDGPILWDRMKSPVDAAPIVAITGAVWLLHQKPAPVEKSYYAEHDVEWI